MNQIVLKNDSSCGMNLLRSKYFREDYRCSGRRLKGRFAIFSRKSISFAKACEEICFFDAT
jgi:hypothetical protein